MTTLQAVSGLEEGQIINDHYSQKQYINRRAGWLGKQPDYTRMLTGLFAIVRRDAGDVFKNDHQLSVQEVRRRELEAEVDPLLPLPTTENTETLDNFRSYPDHEWTPSMNGPVRQAITKNGNTNTDRSLHLPSATVSSMHVHGMSHTTMNSLPLNESQPTNKAAGFTHSSSSSITPPRSLTSAANKSLNLTFPQSANIPVPSIETCSIAMSQSANGERIAQQTSASTGPRSAHHQSSNNSSNLPSTFSVSTDIDHSTRGTTPPQTAPEPAMPTASSVSANASRPQSQLLSNISNMLGTPEGLAATAQIRTGAGGTSQAPLTSSKNVFVPTNVSSLHGRGINSPVKHKRGAKRPAAQSPEATDSVIGSRSSQGTPEAEQPTKRIRLLGPRDPSEPLRETPSPPKTSHLSTEEPTSGNEANRGREYPRIRKPTRDEQRTGTTHATLREQRVSAGKAPRVHKNHLDLVAAGELQPKNKPEAQMAAKMRYDKLSQQYKGSGNEKSRASRAQKGKPDLMPEFFETENFPVGMEDSSVRCVCGVTVDDCEHMISCNECMVWQHTACMGTAVPKDPDAVKYFCQVCDPWAHRELVAAMRKERPLKK